MDIKNLAHRALTILRIIGKIIRDVSDRLVARFPERIRLPSKILGAAILIFVILVVTKPATRPLAPQEKAWAVSVQEINYGTVKPMIPAYGEIVAAREIDLRALVSGEVVEVAIGLEEGAFVKKGEKLLQIDAFQYENALEEAEADLLGAQASLQTSQTDFENAEKLFAKGTVARKYLDDRRTDYLVKKAAFDRLKIIVRRAKRNLENTTVIAPFDAYVSNVNAREGRLISTNDHVAHLGDANNYELRFNLSDAEYGALLNAGSDIVGQPVTAIWQIGNRQVELKAQVRRVGALINQSTRGVDVYADVTDTGNAPLRSGAFVTVAMESSELAQVVVIPATALFDNNIVYVVKESRLEPRRPTILMRASDNVYISGGLEEGSMLLLTRFNEVSPGLLVSVQ
ncbi:MAG: efflux RND transporter periplasmic adaptor subunit [Alphaproteobacteria bacterium]|nr:efflux RND transporter periplasmic adaptor subunit [Alphaproteobacteria bacterium]